MKTGDFNKLYKHAQGVKIVEDQVLTHAAYVWINLTHKQHEKMYNLLLGQGEEEITNAKGVTYIPLGQGGINLLKP